MYVSRWESSRRELAIKSRSQIEIKNCDPNRLSAQVERFELSREMIWRVSGMLIEVQPTK